MPMISRSCDGPCQTGEQLCRKHGHCFCCGGEPDAFWQGEPKFYACFDCLWRIFPEMMGDAAASDFQNDDLIIGNERGALLWLRATERYMAIIDKKAQVGRGGAEPSQKGLF